LTVGIQLIGLAACAPPPVPQAAAAPKPIKPAIKAPVKSTPRLKPVVGLKSGQVTAYLGRPDFIRKDAPAKIWQYQSSLCILDLFLYEEKKDGAYKVTHLEIRGHAKVSVARKECFVSLLKNRQKKTAG
jgi:hypothetical protein